MQWRANINRAFKEYGWCARIRGVQSGGEVINLPTHTFPTDDGGVDLKCPTEIAISDRREAELAKSGLIPLIHRKNTDKAAFIGAQSVYKPKNYSEQGRRRDRLDNLSSRLPYMFAVLPLRPLLKVHGARQGRLVQGKGRAGEVADRHGSANTSIGDPKNSTEATQMRASRWRVPRSRSFPTRRIPATTMPRLRIASAFPA